MGRSRRRASGRRIAGGACLLALLLTYVVFLGFSQVVPTPRFWQLEAGELLRAEQALLDAETPQPEEIQILNVPPPAEQAPPPIEAQSKTPPPPRSHAGTPRPEHEPLRPALAQRAPVPPKVTPPKRSTPPPVVPLPKPVLAQQPPPAPPPPAPPPVAPPPPQEHRLMAELDDNHDDGANPDAHILAEHNHKVQHETVARERNLEREDHVQQQSSPSAHEDAPNAGGEKDKIAALETTTPPAPMQPFVLPNGNPDASRVARGRAAPGPEGTGAIGPLSMRDLPPARTGLEGLTPGDRGDLPAPVTPRAGAPGAPPPGKAGTGGGGGLGQYRLDLTNDDYDRIFGERAVAERQRGASQQSSTTGRWDRKWKIARSSLENYVAEVQPGNQTALNTAAAPFAAFLAHMHRQIHPIFADGFLSDIELKPSDSPFSDLDLWTNLEIVLNPDGTVDKITVVKPSGYLPFDAAVIDAVMSAAPFPAPPGAILSANHKVYLHWGFYRNERACGTFNAEPYILTTPPSGPEDHGTAGAPPPVSSPRAGELAGSGTGRAAGGDAGDDSDAQLERNVDPAGRAKAAEDAASLVPRPDDPAAVAAANAWAAALGTAQVDAMVARSQLPFFSSGRQVASSVAQLAPLYRDLAQELTGAARKSSVRLLSPAQTRAELGALPPSGSDSVPSLYAVVTLGASRIVLTLRRSQGAWKVAALDR